MFSVFIFLAKCKNDVELNKGSDDLVKCERNDKFDKDILVYPEDIYAMRVTPLEFILFLKNPRPYMFQYGLEPQKINRSWIRFYDLVILIPYATDTSKCPEVISVYRSISIASELNSTIGQEVKKLMNFYYEGDYLTTF
jgi:hypothetical protein